MLFYIFLKFLHIFGLSLGYGGVLVVAILSARSLKNEDFFKSVAKVMPILSFVIWVGVVLLFASGVFLQSFLRSEGFDFKGDVWMLEVKKALLVIIVFHGIYVNLYLSRKMRYLADLINPFKDPEFKKFKILGVLSAFISLTLWTAAVILGIWATTKMIL